MLLVNDIDLVKLINDLEKSFGGKKYGDIQNQLVARQMRQLTYKECKQVVERIADNRKYLPTPGEVREEVQATLRDRRKAGGHSGDVVEVEPIRCTSCYDTGFNFVLYNDSETLARCLCKAGDGVLIPLPKTNAKMVVLEFPLKKFKPSQKEINAQNFSQWQVVQWWKTQKEIATDFWLTNKEV